MNGRAEPSGSALFHSINLCRDLSIFLDHIKVDILSGGEIKASSVNDLVKD